MRIIAPVLLVLLQLTFWKLRIHDASGLEGGLKEAGDLHFEHFPMVAYAIGRLGEGELPLWNPHQLFGLPFLAVPHPGVLYPPNAIYLWMDAAMAIEFSLIAHLALAALGTYGLTRELGASRVGAFAAALGFTWSNHVLSLTPQHAWLVTTSWMPTSLWLVERVLRERRLAGAGLALVVAAQLLAGSHEAFIHNLAAAGLFAVFRLAELARVEARTALVRGGRLLGSVALGMLLAAPQLIPTLELVVESSRWSDPPDSQRVGLLPRVPLSLLWGWTLEGALAGSLLVVAVPLALGLRGGRNVTAFCLTLLALGGLLATGSPLYDLYRETPLGALFRRPAKFATFCNLAGAILVALALTHLGRLQRGARAEIWRRPEWWVALAGAVIAAGWLAWQSGPPLASGALLLALLLFGVGASRRARGAALLGLVLVQLGQLFLGARVSLLADRPEPRPLKQRGEPPPVPALLEAIRRRAGIERVYVSRDLWWGPLYAKQASVEGFYAAHDYQALAPRRHRRFFEEAAGARIRQGFIGNPHLGAFVRWDVLDLSSIRLLLLRRGERLDRVLRGIGERPGFEALRAGFRPVTLDAAAEEEARGLRVRLYERPTALPRAYFVPTARIVADEEEVLAALRGGGPALRREVLLELEGRAPPPEGTPGAEATVRIEELAAERVIVEVQASGRGFLVLTDSFFRGWSAHANGEELALYRGNSLFRAVPVPAGTTRVRFEYRPESLRVGIFVGALATLVWIGGFARALRSRPAGGSGASPGPPGSHVFLPGAGRRPVGTEDRDFTSGGSREAVQSRRVASRWGGTASRWRVSRFHCFR